MYYHILPYITIYYHILPYITTYYHILPHITTYYHYITTIYNPIFDGWLSPLKFHCYPDILMNEWTEPNILEDQHPIQNYQNMAV